MAVGRPPCCGRLAAIDCCSSTSKLPRKKRVRPSAPSLLGLGVSLGCCLAWGNSGSSSVVARASWIDPDTLPEYHTKDFEGDERHFDLVFSDEFDRYGELAVKSWLCVSRLVLEQGTATYCGFVFSGARLAYSFTVLRAAWQRGRQLAADVRVLSYYC